MIIRLVIQLGLDSLEQATINNGRLFALEDLALKSNLADIEAIA